MLYLRCPCMWTSELKINCIQKLVIWLKSWDCLWTSVVLFRCILILHWLHWRRRVTCTVRTGKNWNSINQYIDVQNMILSVITIACLSKPSKNYFIVHFPWRKLSMVDKGGCLPITPWLRRPTPPPPPSAHPHLPSPVPHQDTPIPLLFP